MAFVLSRILLFKPRALGCALPVYLCLCIAPAVQAEVSPTFGTLRCGPNPGSYSEVSDIPGMGASKEAALADSGRACAVKRDEVFAMLDGIIRGRRCPAQCPERQYRLNGSGTCGPVEATARCEEDQIPAMQRFCAPYKRIGLSEEACLHFICSLASSPTPWVSRTRYTADYSVIINCFR